MLTLKQTLTRLQARISLYQHFSRRSVCRPRLGSNNILDERDILAAAHDAAKINFSQRANVRLARSGGVLGAQCVERKQPPPQDAPAAHIFNPKPLFLFPSEHPKPYSYLVCKSFDDSECCCFPKSAYDSFIMSHHRVIGQIQKNGQKWSLSYYRIVFSTSHQIKSCRTCMRIITLLSFLQRQSNDVCTSTANMNSL